LKVVHLFPVDLDLGSITAQAEQLAQLLSDVAAEKYAITLRIMLANLRRKIGLTTSNNPDDSHPILNAPDGGTTGAQSPENLLVTAGRFQQPTPAPFTVEELGFNWSADWGLIDPSNLPVWIQEQSFSDLGLPVDGSDSVFLQFGDPNGWGGVFPQMPEAR